MITDAHHSINQGFVFKSNINLDFLDRSYAIFKNITVTKSLNI